MEELAAGEGDDFGFVELVVFEAAGDGIGDEGGGWIAVGECGEGEAEVAGDVEDAGLGDAAEDVVAAG